MVRLSLALMLLGWGCGDDLLFSAKSACYRECDKQVSCMTLTNSALNGCQLACDDTSRDTRACSNEDEVWKAVRDNCTKDAASCTEGGATHTQCLATELAKCKK